MTSAISSDDAPKVFPQTRWSVVAAANQQYSPASVEALEAICRAYWHPLYAYARRAGQSPHDAQDTTQAFFACLIEKQWLETADREKGRLRTFFIAALKNFMAKEWRRSSAQKRGGNLAHVDLESAETFYATDLAAKLAPDEVYDRQWALTLLELTMKRLQAEFAAAGKMNYFDILKNCLTAARGSIDYSAIAAQLGLNAGAARVAVHRLRHRFREVYLEEISQTLGEGADLHDELRHLTVALARDS